MTNIMAADIGGTNARFALFNDGPQGLVMGPRVWLDSAGVTSFAELLQRLRQHGPDWAGEAVDVTSLAVAGPVRDGIYCAPPNLDWDVDLSDPAAFGLGRVVLVNDFVAQACATLTGAMGGALPILPGNANSAGTIAVIGAGTGLGKAALVPDGHGGYVPFPTEGGHALFPFEGQREFDFQRFLMQRTGRGQVIGDMVVSGAGLSALHAFLTGEELTPVAVAERLAHHSQTMEWMARFYGRACRDFALETLALGGVVICGGVAARNPELVRHAAFGGEFRRSDTHAALLAEVPVRLNTNEDSGLWGAAYLGGRDLAT